MYIPYEETGNFLYKILKNESLKNFFYEKKISQNLKFIADNKPKVIEKIQNKLKHGKKIKVVFYVYDETKWKCQTVYEIFENDDRFEVQIIVTKSAAQNTDNPTYQSKEDILKAYEFFKRKNLNTALAYDFENGRYVPFKTFNPDIIIYQHPWYVERSQGPVVCSEFALTCYVPYYFPIEIEGSDKKIDYYLRFHKYVERYYALDKYVENKLKSKMDNHGENVVVSGLPNLDYFINNNESGDYVIYSPHWTVGGLGLTYGTFEWNGKYMLEYAKSHPEIKWVFKPHSILKKALVDTKIMTEDEAKAYYNEWDKIGFKYEGGDYLELFAKSKMMITDSSSFLGEYFVTEKPLILLMSDTSQFSSLKNPILKTYYCARNLDDLKHFLSILPEDDYMKEERLKTLDELGLKNNHSSEIIFSDILNMIGEEYGK